MDSAGKDPNAILTNAPEDHSSWHFFQARSWLDYAKRSQIPSTIHYAAFELRYGIEYLLFELLVLANDTLTVHEYERCLGDPKEMKKMLGTLGVNYHKLSEFTQALLSLTPGAPRLIFWSIDELFRFWGIASSYLHFVGAHILTYGSEVWFIKAIAELDSILEKLWKDINESIGKGVFRPSKMEPEVRAAWIDFQSGAINRDELILRMRILKPLLDARRMS
jgi:hypothetical protein